MPPVKTAKNVREGFSLRDQPHTFPDPTFLRNRKIKIRLAPSSTLNEDVFTFTYKTANSEVLRMAPNPIVLKYSATEPNPHYVTDDDERAALGGTDAWKAKKQVPCMMGMGTAAKTERRAYINTAAGGNAWFSSCLIDIDGEDICSYYKPQGPTNGYYSYFQKLFLTEEERVRLYDVRHLVTCSKEDQDETGDAKLALDTLNFENANSPKFRSLRTTFEGVPWMGYARNAQVSKLEGKKPAWNYLVLRPGTELAVHFRKHSPMWSYLEQQYVTNAAKGKVAYSPRTLHSGDDSAVAPAKYEVKLEDMFLEAEAMSFDTALPKHRAYLARLEKSTQTQHIDIPNTSLLSVPTSTTRADLQFDLAPNTPLAYVAFAYRDNVFFNAASNHTTTYRCTWPTNCKKISFTLGSEEILFQNGLSDLSVDGSVDRERFYQYLRDKNFFDYDNPDYFVRDTKGFSYRVVFPIDLAQYGMKLPTALGVHLEFNDQLSPDKLLAICCRVEPHKLVRVDDAGKSRWSVQRV